MSLLHKDSPSSSAIEIQVGRMGAGMETVKAEKGASVKSVLEENDFEVGSNENVYVNGGKIEKKDLGDVKITRGTIIAIVGGKEGGIQ